MKKKLLSIVATVIAIWIYTSSTAQLKISNMQKAVDLYEPNFTSSITEKKVNATEVDIRTRLHFSQNFAEANDVTWIKTANGFVAMVNQEGLVMNVGYKKHGHWMYTIKRHQQENLLPQNVRAQVKSAYYDYKILHILEINVPENENTIYLFILQDEHTLLTLRVCDGVMDIIDEGTRE